MPRIVSGSVSASTSSARATGASPFATDPIVVGENTVYRITDADLLKASFARSRTEYSDAMVAAFATPSGPIADDAITLEYNHGVREWWVNARYEDFGDGYRSSESDPIHFYALPGSYDVTLEVGDGADEALVIVWQSSGGSGTFNYIALLDRVDGAWRNTATTALGDRVRVTDATIGPQGVDVSVIEHDEDDPACCPTRTAIRRYDTQLTPLP